MSQGGNFEKKKRLLYVFFNTAFGNSSFQGVVPFSMLFFSGVKRKFRKNTVNMDSHITEKPSVDPAECNE